MQAIHDLSNPVRGTSALGSHFETTSDFEALFIEHFPRVVAVLRRIVGEQTRAEDLANEVFWKLYTNRHLLLDGNVSGWLYRTATRAGIDAIRAANRRSRHEQSAALQTHDEGPEQPQLADLIRAEQRAKVQSVLSGMKPAQAQIVLLRADGASYNEIAEVLGVAPSSVGTLLNRAEAEFRKRYLKLAARTKTV